MNIENNIILISKLFQIIYIEVCHKFQNVILQTIYKSIHESNFCSKMKTIFDLIKRLSFFDLDENRILFVLYVNAKSNNYFFVSNVPEIRIILSIIISFHENIIF